VKCAKQLNLLFKFKTIQFIDLKTRHQLIGDKINARIQKIMGHGQFILCPEVRKLLLKVEDIMVIGEDIPYFGLQLKIKDVLLEINKKGLGFGIITNDKMEIEGVFTDGELRRTIDANINLPKVTVGEVMN